MAKKLNLVVREGETFTRIIRWETPPFVYKAITGISKTAPVRITAVGHGLTPGWRAAVVSVLGMREINAEHIPPRESEYHQVTVVSADAVDLNKINSSEYNEYVSGGYLQYYSPVGMSGYRARMMVKDRVDGVLLLTLTSEPPDQRITLDDVNHTITMEISAEATSEFAFTKGVYDLEMVSPTGVVTTLFTGSITVSKEVTV